MAYQIHLFNSSAERVAIIQDGIIKAASIDQSIDGAPTLSFTIPQNDPKAAFISPLYYAKVYNTQTSAYEFSIFELVDPDIVDSASELSIKATYQGILTRLSSEYVDTYDTTSSGKSFSTVIAELLALQVNTPAITVGTIEPTATIAIAADSSDIYSILKNIRDAYGGWFEVDASRALNWYNDNTNTPDREIRRKKNLKAITYTPGYSQIVNRVYAYGNGETDARLNLKDAGEAHEYIEDATSQSLYGIKAKKYIDKSITHPATLLAYAQRILEEYKNPPYQYSVDIVNLADVNGYDYSLESLGLDTRIRVIDDLLSVDVDTAIVSMSINLLAPEEISVELNTVKNDLSDLFSKIVSVQDIQSSVATQIGAGQVTVLGTFTVIDWASAGTTTIDGGNITANTITTTQLNFTPATSTDIIATINASAEGIAITGDRISITGSTDFASGYDPTDKVADLGGQYDSAASGARVRIFPDANTGILITDGTNDVFKTLVGGTDVGDVIIGDYSGGKGAKWDNSASTFDIQGTLTACTVGTGDTLYVNGSINVSNQIIFQKQGNFGDIQFDNYGRVIIYNNFTDLDEYMRLTFNSLTFYSTAGDSTSSVYISANGNIYADDIYLTGDVECDYDLTCGKDLDVGGNAFIDGNLNLNSSTAHLTFDDSTHYLYRSGNDLYWYNGSTGTKLN